MKQKIKFLAIAAMAITLSLSLASCSDDDDNDANGSYTYNGVTRDILSAGYAANGDVLVFVLCPNLVTDNFETEPAEYIYVTIMSDGLGKTITIEDDVDDLLDSAYYQTPDGDYEFYSGTLRIDDNGNKKFTVTFNVTLGNGKTLSGSYSGVMKVIVA
jgi:hypothetical protein